MKVLGVFAAVFGGFVSTSNVANAGMRHTSMLAQRAMAWMGEAADRQQNC